MVVLSINELLCFVSAQADKLPSDFLRKKLRDFYSLEEVTRAKQLLLQEFDREILSLQKNKGKAASMEKPVQNINSSKTFSIFGKF